MNNTNLPEEALTNKPTRAKELYEILKDHPKVAMAWAEAEIKCYQDLIEIIKSKIIEK